MTTSPNTSDPAVMIPIHRGNEARKKEQLDFLAAQAAALFRFAEIEALTDAAAAGAFGSWLTGRGVPNSPLVEASRSEVKAWLKRVERCGWEALAQGACP
ncbi:MAG TPA: hypothetical protein QGF58_24850 [Myxococcota bacterium]|nr:hypothetical protein [Myxococcota bacterium]